jgi:hypothetical protein
VNDEAAQKPRDEKHKPGDDEFLVHGLATFGRSAWRPASCCSRNRVVTHIDDTAIAALTSFYREALHTVGVLLEYQPSPPLPACGAIPRPPESNRQTMHN